MMRLLEYAGNASNTNVTIPTTPTTRYIGYTTRWGCISVHEAEIPPVGPTQLQVNVTNMALNPIDIKLKSLRLYPRVTSAGKEFSGTVMQVGEALAGVYKEGDRICGCVNGSSVLGSVTVIDVLQSMVCRSPNSFNDAQAAAFPFTFGTANEMLARTSGKGNLLILGGGSNVGSFAVQLAKRAHAFDKIVATCSSRSDEFVRSLGAIETVDYTKPNLGEQLKSLDTKFDAIIDTVGGYEALAVWQDILKTSAEGGVYVTIVGDSPPSASYKNTLVRPVVRNMPWVVPRYLIGKLWGLNYQFVLGSKSDWMAEVPLEGWKVRIDSIYPLTDCKAAWERASNVNRNGKVLISMQ